MKFKDRYGFPISTSSGLAAERWAEGMDLLLSQSFGPEEKFKEAIQADEEFALAHSDLAYTLMLRAQVADAKESARRALALGAGISRRERQHVEAISMYANGQGSKSLALIREHLSEFPRDVLVLRLAQRLFMLGCSGAGVANFPEELLALLKSVAPSYGDDWAFLGQYAFAHHEAGLLKDALQLAQRSLELNPANAVASHSVTHVFFEEGDHFGGADFLGNWIKGFDKRAPYRVHLTWHLALFELAMGRYQRVLDLYETDIRPSVLAKSAASLADSASLMWRLQIYGGVVPPVPWEEVRDQAAPAAERPGPAFRDAHAALAFAAVGDEVKLGQMMDGLRGAAGRGDSLAREVTLPLVLGIGAFARGAYEEAVGLIEPVFHQLIRIGGSHAQREVFEDTLLEGYLRARRFDKAEEMLRGRLRGRSSTRDLFWLGRAQASNGQTEGARALLHEVAQRWQEADPAFPELSALNDLTEAVL